MASHGVSEFLDGEVYANFKAAHRGNPIVAHYCSYSRVASGAGMIHPTRPILVWVDADLGIADLVEHLNTIPGVRTVASCQGTIGEGGANPYRAQVMATWTDEAEARLRRDYDITTLGDHWGYVHPRERV